MGGSAGARVDGSAGTDTIATVGTSKGSES